MWVGDPGKLPGNPGAKRLAGYLSKYIAKELEREGADGLAVREPGKRRYYPNCGWPVPTLRRRFWSREAAEDWLEGLMGRSEFSQDFRSEEVPAVYGTWHTWPDGALWPPWD